MHRFAQCTEIWKSSKIQSFTHLAITVMKCGSSIVMNFLSYFNHTTQLFRKLFSTNLSLNSYLNYDWFYWKILTHNVKNGIYIIFPITHICAHVLCRICDIWIRITSSKRCNARNPLNYASILYNAWLSTSRFGILLANLGSIMYQIHISNVIIGQGPLGYASAMAQVITSVTHTNQRNR